MHVCVEYPLGWQFTQAKLFDVCSPPGILACVNDQFAPGCLWQFEH
jgi:hypothetical protein